MWGMFFETPCMFKIPNNKNLNVSPKFTTLRPVTLTSLNFYIMCRDASMKN